MGHVPKCLIQTSLKKQQPDLWTESHTALFSEALLVAQLNGDSRLTYTVSSKQPKWEFKVRLADCNTLCAYVWEREREKKNLQGKKWPVGVFTMSLVQLFAVSTLPKSLSFLLGFRDLPAAVCI